LSYETAEYLRGVDSVHVNLLCELGITPIQARVYLALYNSGESTVRSLVESLHIHRADAYRAVQRLQSLGVIELTIGNPNKYSAIPPNEAVAILTENLEKNMTSLKKKALRLVSLLEARKKTIEERETQQTEQFFKLKSGETVIRSILNLVGETEREIKEVASTDALKYHLTYGLADLERDAIRRGVSIRLVTDTKPAPALRNYVNLVETRFLKDLSESLKFIIIDDKLTQIALAAQAKVKSEAFALTTNNKTLVRSLSTHFEELWKTAKPNV
jgi:sugar-specific transcriptional regulator TrmB